MLGNARWHPCACLCRSHHSPLPCPCAQEYTRNQSDNRQSMVDMQNHQANEARLNRDHEIQMLNKGKDACGIQ